LTGRIEAFGEEDLDWSDVDQEMSNSEIQCSPYGESRDSLLTEEIGLGFVVGHQCNKAMILDEQISKSNVAIRVP
jgi:hypothetical protein